MPGLYAVPRGGTTRWRALCRGVRRFDSAMVRWDGVLMLLVMAQPHRLLVEGRGTTGCRATMPTEVASMDLLEETRGTLERNGVSETDIAWCGSVEFGRFTWDRFCELAAGVYYDAGFGSPCVATDLVIAGSDWWLTRGEYDGSEWWTFNRMPAMPDAADSVERLAASRGDWGWQTLEDLHTDDDDDDLGR